MNKNQERCLRLKHPLFLMEFLFKYDAIWMHVILTIVFVVEIRHRQKDVNNLNRKLYRN